MMTLGMHRRPFEGRYLVLFGSTVVLTVLKKYILYFLMKSDSYEE